MGVTAQINNILSKRTHTQSDRGYFEAHRKHLPCFVILKFEKMGVLEGLDNPLGRIFTSPEYEIDLETPRAEKYLYWNKNIGGWCIMVFSDLVTTETNLLK